MGAVADAHARPAPMSPPPSRSIPPQACRPRTSSATSAVGTNELQAAPPPSLLKTVLKAVSEPFVVLLFVAGALAVALGEVRDGLLVLVGLLPIVGADVVTSTAASTRWRRCATPRRRGPASGGTGPSTISPPRTSSQATSCSCAPATSCPRTCG